MPQPNPRFPRRGRGALSNADSRFLSRRTEAYDDGWGSLEQALEEEARPRTTVTAERTREILTTNDSPDISFDRSINPYKGCEHGCSYCFARPTHAYLDLSPGLDFETRLFSKPEGPALLRRAFDRRGYRPSVIAIGANTDPYQPVERELRITRGLLEVMEEYRHPCVVVTKSRGVLRDLDILGSLAEQGLVRILFSITTLDPELATRMEPRATAPAGRLEAMRRLNEHGVPVGVLVSPVIPALTDGEVERILEAAHVAGARSAGTILLRLTQEVASIFEEWLETHLPQRKEHVLSLLRQAHGGQLYRSDFGHRQAGAGPWAQMLQRRFRLTVERLGMHESETELRTDLFRRPPRRQAQLGLFGDRDEGTTAS